MTTSQQSPSTHSCSLQSVYQVKVPAYTQGHTSEMMAAHQIRSTSGSYSYFTSLLTSRPAAHNLDVGCSPGSITADLPPTYQKAKLLKSTLPKRQFRRHRRNHHFQLTAHSKLPMSTIRLPFPDDSFDVVHAHHVIEHLSNPVHALAEMRRVCRPGGFVASRDGDWDTLTIFPGSPSLKQYMEIYGAIVRSSGAEPNAGQCLRYLAVQAGFSDDRITYSASQYCLRGLKKHDIGLRRRLNVIAKVPSRSRLSQRVWLQRRRLLHLVRRGWNGMNNPGLSSISRAVEVVCWKGQ